ncbi:MAG: tetratricopeptide repeat protein [Mariprofundaceae bacterium]|nr:tetratricopeptide repeat protein [Mariprofundaceae bacterium]
MNENFLYLAAQDALRQGQHELAIQFLTPLVEKQPQENAPRLQLAELLLRANRVEQATIHINAVLGDSKASSATNAEQAYPFTLRARAMAMSGQADEAMDILSTLLDTQPDLTGARMLHITLLVGLKRLEEAHLSINEAIHSNEVPEIRKVQADLFLRQNRIDEAIKSLEAMQKLDINDETPLLLLHQIALQQGNNERAEQLLRNYIETNPQAILARNALGRLLIQSGRTREAVTIYQGLVRDTGGNSEALSALGLLYYQLKDYANAASQFQNALKNSPDDQSRFYLAACLEALERRDEAEKLYEQIGRSSPAYVDAQLRLAGMALAANNSGAAEKRVKTIISEFGSAADAYMLLSSIYLIQQKYRKLLTETETALSLPDLSSRLLFNRAVAYEYFKEYDGVESSLKRLLSMEPKNSEALNFLGYTYAEQKIKLDEAETLIRAALAEKPDDGYYLDSLAWVYYQRGEHDKAIEIQAKAISQVSSDPVMHEHMGDMLWKKGDQPNARNSWQKALELRHTNPGLIKRKISEGLSGE